MDGDTKASRTAARSWVRVSSQQAAAFCVDVTCQALFVEVVVRNEPGRFSEHLRWRGWIGRCWHAPRFRDRFVSRRFTQQRVVEQLRALAEPYRFRVQLDAEGFPVIPGRYGQIEWYCDGVNCWSCALPGQVALAVYTDRLRLFEKLWAIPGVKRHQTGDTEIRAVFPPEAMEEVAWVIKARCRRSLSPAEARRLGMKTAYRVTSQAREPSSSAGPSGVSGE